MSIQAGIRGLQSAAGKHGQEVRNYMTESHSDPLLQDSIAHTNSNGSLATIKHPIIPPGTMVVPINFGIKFKPPKLGLQYHLPDKPLTHHVYEVNIQYFIN